MSIRRSLLFAFILGIILKNEAEGFFLPSFQFSGSAAFGRYNASFGVQSRSSNSDRTINDIITNAKNIAEEFQDIFDLLQGEMESESDEADSEFSANVTEAIDSQLNRFNDSTDLSECIQEGQDAFETLLNDTLLDMGKCFTDQLAEGMRIASECLTNQANAVALAESTAQEFSRCISLAGGNPFLLLSPSVIACKARLALVAGAGMANLSAERARIAIAAGAFLSTMKIDLAACGLTAIATAAGSAADIAANIGLCISN